VYVPQWLVATLLSTPLMIFFALRRHILLQVYRMHSLLPDSVDVREASSGSVITTVNLGDIILEKGTQVNTTVPLPDLFYTLGVGHAGTPVFLSS
jgi:hypothetical protein